MVRGKLSMKGEREKGRAEYEQIWKVKGKSMKGEERRGELRYDAITGRVQI